MTNSHHFDGHSPGKRGLAGCPLILIVQWFLPDRRKTFISSLIQSHQAVLDLSLGLKTEI